MLQTIADTDYAARYPNIYKGLLDAYEKALEKEADPLCIERAAGIMIALAALKQDGVISIEFARSFHIDIAQIIDASGKGIRPKDRSKGQEHLTYMMMNLLKNFGS